MYQSLLLKGVLCLMLCFSGKMVVAQSSTDLGVLKKQCDERAGMDRDSEDDTHRKLFLPTRILFGLYRTVLSEQIAADCAFDLTCSRFSIAAIRRFGILKGGLLTTDRLTRCHIFVAQETVPLHFNNQTGKVFDVPAMY